MTKKLYHENQYQTSFTAVIMERLEVDGKPAVILDQTAFYPNAGGQPCDTGVLNEIRVKDVSEDSAGRILHILAAPLAVDTVTGQIDWARRFDLMQQHTGQHLLSQAILTSCGAETISMHIGDDVSTIDIKQVRLTDEQITQAEDVANRIIYENRQVTAHWVTKDEIGRFPLRKMPVVDENIRILEIQEFDFSPCGGTHCSRTGEIGIVKARKWEAYKGGTRVHFVCGGRALRDYQRKTLLVRQFSETLTSGENDLPDHLAKLQEEFKALKRDYTGQMKQLFEYEARALATECLPRGSYRVLTKTFENRGANELKFLAEAVLQQSPNTVALLGGKAEGKAVLVFMRSENLPGDMNALMKTACGVLNGRGGGQPHQAQGGGPAIEKLEDALRLAEAMIH